MRFNITTIWKDYLPSVREYRLFLIIMALVYIALFGALLVATDFLPYVMDNNESFSSLLHARNTFNFGLSKSFGLTDESYALHPEAHPYVYTHGGNFPRVFALIIYILGVRSIENQILVTTFTIGFVALFFIFHYFSKVGGPRFAALACMVMMTDYILYAQWHVTTFHVWHAFFLFAALCCAHGLAESLNKRWFVLTFITFLCLFYYEITFAFFVGVLNALYLAALLYRKRKKLVMAWAAQFLGSLSAVAVFVAQIVAYYGWGNFKKNVALTFFARNLSKTGAESIAQFREFFDSLNIVFWYNFFDTSSVNNFSSFMRSFFLYVFDIYTPLFTLITLILVGGWLAALTYWRFWRFGAWINSKGRWYWPWLADLETGGKTHRVDGCFVALFLPSVVFLAAMLFGAPFTGAVLQEGSFYRELLTVFVLTSLAAMACWKAASLSVVRWPGWDSISIYRFVWAGLFLIIAAWFIRVQPALYDLGHAPVWSEMLSPWRIPWVPVGVIVVAAASAVALILFGAERVLGQDRKRNLPGMLKYLGCGLVAYAITYKLFPGYIFSGYLVRYVPFPFFLIAPLLAAAFFVLLKTGCFALRHFYVRVRSSSLFFKVREHTCWRNQIAEVWSFIRGSGGIAVATFFVACLVIFIASYWIHMQAAYIRLLPPTQLTFIKKLARPPYRGASFVTSNYAAPVALMTGQWAYQGEAWVVPQGEGFTIRRDTRYLWMADKDTNPDYERPEYFLYRMFPGYHTILWNLLARSGNWQGSESSCLNHELVRLAESLDRPGLRHKLVDRDDSPLGSWAIVKIDWDFLEDLEPLHDLPSGNHAKFINESIKVD